MNTKRTKNKLKSWPRFVHITVAFHEVVSLVQQALISKFSLRQHFSSHTQLRPYTVWTSKRLLTWNCNRRQEWARIKISLSWLNVSFQHESVEKAGEKARHFFIGLTCPKGTKESLIMHNVQNKVPKVYSFGNELYNNRSKKLIFCMLSALTRKIASTNKPSIPKEPVYSSFFSNCDK